MNIEKSKLYLHLCFIRGLKSNYNVKEIFSLVLGYQLGTSEKWIGEFCDFIDERLLDKYYDCELDKLPKNYGEVIFENQESDEDGVRYFFYILEDFRKYLSQLEDE